MIQKRMKALRLYAPWDMRLVETDMPICGDNEMILRVEGCGICGSDLQNFSGGQEWNAPPEKRFIESPVTAGHEFYGRVVEIGKNISKYQLGDLLIPEQIVPCGYCRFCTSGHYWMCQNLLMYGFQNEVNGGFAQYVKIHKRSLNHSIPAHFTVEQASLIEPLACSMHAVERADIRHEDVVVISGLGAIGLGMVAIARLKLPKMIIGLDIRENRRLKALEYGADLSFDPSSCDEAVEKIKALTGGYGCDVYMEASGNAASVAQGLQSIRSLGRYIQFGIFPGQVAADWNCIGDGKELDLRGSHLGPHCFDAVIRGIEANIIPTKGLVTHKFAMRDWSLAYKTAREDPKAIKVVIVPED